ncbi:MAG: hypothetical protein HOI67_10625 [Gammaproteobacteria bacterium]|nr:hypothetical protein [Gammaproteobacteria bacterium]
MIPMTVTKKQQEGFIVFHHPDAEFTNTSACIKDDVVAAIQPHMNTGGVATIFYGAGAWRRDGPADPIEGD